MIKNDQWAVVTGASSGIGRAFAELFARDGINLFIIARDSEVLQQYAKELENRYEISVKVFAGDLSKPSIAIKCADFVISHKTSVDYLINNAGFGGYGAFSDTSWGHERSMIALNIEALTYLTKRFIGVMKTEGSGRIVNVASIAGFLSGPNMAVYYATKAYVLHFSEAVHREMLGSGVSVTALCPGPTETGFAKAAYADNTSIFKGKLPSAQDVAAYGYKAMMQAKPVAIHGFRNRVVVAMIRLLPRQMVTKIVGRTQG